MQTVKIPNHNGFNVKLGTDDLASTLEMGERHEWLPRYQLTFISFDPWKLH